MACALLAALLGLAILHLRGHYFAIARLVVPDVLREIINSWTALTGGGMGINLSRVGGSVEAQEQFYFWIMAGRAVLAGLHAVMEIRSPLSQKARRHWVATS